MQRLLIAVGAAVLGLLCPSLAPAAAPRKPNIIFILADDLGYGDLACYGQKQIRTPHLDRLAAQGVRFTQCYAGSTVCAPSRCSLMTGKHTGHGRIRGNARVPLRPEDVTVAEVLKKSGYRTALVGKWGLGEPGTTGVPNHKGFDYFFGYLNQVHAHNYYPDYLWRNQEKVPLENVVVKGVATKRVQYSPDLFTREALGFIEKNRKGPFFLYLAYTLPHANNEAGRNGMEVPSDAPYSDRTWPQAQKNHAAMITRLDGYVGQILKRLDELKLADDTIVFFTSDNGPHKEGGADPLFFHSAGPLQGYKRDLTEGGIREPMIVRWPGHIQAGRVSDQVWAFWDFLPTAAELVGAKAPEGLDGISMVPALLGKGTRKQHEFLYWEFHERGFQQAVRMGDWKAIRKKLGGPLELYDLKTDVGEKHDAAAAHPEVVAKIEAYLKGARSDSKEFPVRPAGPKKGGWTKSAANPVLGGKLGTCFDVALLKEGGTFRMWFSWRPKKSIALVESKDGIHWGEPVIALGPNPASGWEDEVNRPVVLKQGDSYHLWYTGQARGHSWIGHAVSADGKTWKRTGVRPVLAPEAAWEKAAVMCPHVFWDGAKKQLRMWYSAGEQYEPNAIGHATSPDGLTWTKNKDNPIFRPDPRIAWEKHKVTACQVVPHRKGYVMFYIGFRDENHAQIGLARSLDGISDWQRHPANPILGPSRGEWDEDAVYKPFALIDGQRWLLWYNGRRGGVEQIGLAIHQGLGLGF